jgi:antitoxin HicB
MLSYPVTLTPDSNGSLLVGFPDVENANSVGTDPQEALAHAIDALKTAFEICIDERRPIPLPSPVRHGETSVTLPAQSTAKVLLWNEMLAQQVRKAELARRLGVQQPQIDRLFDLTQSSGIDLIERAAKALGKRIEVSLG